MLAIHYWRCHCVSGNGSYAAADRKTAPPGAVCTPIWRCAARCGRARPIDGLPLRISRRAPAHGPTGLPSTVDPTSQPQGTLYDQVFSTIIQAALHRVGCRLATGLSAEQIWPAGSSGDGCGAPHPPRGSYYLSGPNPRRKISALGLFRELARHPGRATRIRCTLGPSLPFCLLQNILGGRSARRERGGPDSPPATGRSGCFSHKGIARRPRTVRSGSAPPLPGSKRPAQADRYAHRPCGYRTIDVAAPDAAPNSCSLAPDTARFFHEGGQQAKSVGAQAERLYHGSRGAVSLSSTMIVIFQPSHPRWTAVCGAVVPHAGHQLDNGIGLMT